ncbi:MAG: hypothetical protein L0229_27980 [Blastocatellia bacterium]|nr:hypothetical protein [Blastocatellia bacterium]
MIAILKLPKSSRRAECGMRNLFLPFYFFLFTWSGVTVDLKKPKGMTQPPLPHPLRFFVLLCLSLLSVFAMADAAPVAPTIA